MKNTVPTSKRPRSYQDPHPKVSATQRRSSYISWGHTCNKSGTYSAALLSGSCLSLWAAGHFPLALLRVLLFVTHYWGSCTTLESLQVATLRTGPAKGFWLTLLARRSRTLPQGVSLTFQNLFCSCLPFHSGASLRMVATCARGFPAEKANFWVAAVSVGLVDMSHRCR